MTDREIQRREAHEERMAIMIYDGEIEEERAYWFALDCVEREFGTAKNDEGKRCLKKLERLQK